MQKRIPFVLMSLLIGAILIACGLSAPISSTPTHTPIPGWEKFEAGRVEIWLPESYDGGDPSQDLDLIVEKIKALGPDFAQAAQMIEQNPSAFVFWAFDSDIGDTGVLTNVNIATERVPSAITVETYLDLTTKQLPGQISVVKRESVSLDSYQAGRMFLESLISGMGIKQVMYVIKEDNTMWVVNFTTGANEFDRRLPAFEQSMQSFNIRP